MTTTAAAPNLAEQISDLLMAGGTLGDVYDYSDQDYEVLYALGHGLYSQARYFDAFKVFGFLVAHNHLEPKYMIAFASSMQMLKKFEDALIYYSLASVMDMSDPRPTFHSAECLLALGRSDEAIEGFNLVVKQTKDEQYPELKARAQTLLDLISKKKG
jgi:type III secretion system low calcium response chaperone LcrH/SycD